MNDAESRREAGLIADLNDLLQLDHDAVEAYTIAIDTIRDERYREALARHRADHKRHIEELAALVREHGGLPTEMPHPTGSLKLAVQGIGAAGGDLVLLLAFKAVEGQVRDKYQRFAARRYPQDVADVIRRGAEDERRHYDWVEAALTERGAGRGTLPHGLAQVVERVHKVVADPAERLERAVMRRVGQALGTTRTRGGAAAPSPIDVAAAVVDAAAGAATSAMPESVTASSASGDAARFIEALRAVEEAGDIERMVALFDDDAEISNPHDIAPHRGRDGARRFWQAYRDSFEQIHSDFSKVVQGENTAMLEWTSTGRVVSGDPVTYSGVSVLETRDGRVHRFRAYFDTHDLETHGPRAD